MNKKLKSYWAKHVEQPSSILRDQLDILKEQNKLEMLGAKSSDALGSSDVQSLAPPKVAALNAPAADVLSNESAVWTDEEVVAKETK